MFSSELARSSSSTPHVRTFTMATEPILDSMMKSCSFNHPSPLGNHHNGPADQLPLDGLVTASAVCHDTPPAPVLHNLLPRFPTYRGSKSDLPLEQGCKAMQRDTAMAAEQPSDQFPEHLRRTSCSQRQQCLLSSIISARKFWKAVFSVLLRHANRTSTRNFHAK